MTIFEPLFTKIADVLDAAHIAAANAVKAEIATRPEDEYAFDCGFAWVIVDGRSPLANYCRAKVKEAGGERHADRGLGSKGYPTGWQFWCPGNFNGQSVRIFRVGAEAFSAKLAEFGITSSVGSRLD